MGAQQGVPKMAHLAETAGLGLAEGPISPAGLKAMPLVRRPEAARGLRGDGVEDVEDVVGCCGGCWC